MSRKWSGRWLSDTKTRDGDGFPVEDADHVSEAYRYVLRREVDPDGLAYHLDRLGSGAERASVLHELTESTEFDSLSGKAGAQWPLEPPTDYLGQLSDEVQGPLRSAAADLSLDDCEPYHSLDLPSGEEFKGPWDLRGREMEYLGGLDLNGVRVLDFGPASGHLSFWMESQGARVTCLEVGYDRSVDVVPVEPERVSQFRRAIMDTVRRVNNGWWYAHRLFQSEAEMLYGDIYSMPADLGRFDIALFGSILLHLERPLRALSSGARLADTVVVCEPAGEFGESPDVVAMKPLPTGAENLTGWWQISPGATIKMLECLGFDDFDLSFHAQRHHVDHEMNSDPVDVPMYTVVARRGASAV